ncbi:hypothetical protein CANARDRAFT_197537 [[Candida] arabinofermentans NRRL YB-2248]|uniref:RING-type domain-containing protein n=1 Tax=[Candida] arabinofermentans NRRL YB-2248 TaxID=983967 RepID=A0A1E4T2E0_9ASCO|nr:hypothetical protein CANARDRAFT_197537 [[Candida] arabinofermentans NRRL YB-2248]
MIEERLANYDHLTYLTFEQFSDQYFLRNRIKEILQLNITPLDQRFLIQKLMSRSYLEKQKYEKEDDVENENEDEDEVVLTADDKEPTYYNLEENILGCQHYQRNCKIECSFCKKWYTCRLCHDQEISSHQLQRAKTTHILCMFCSTPQFPQQYCINCDKKLSEYYCDKCKLFDNDPLKNIYHCDSCGICRLGLGLNQDYFHCDNCNACISIELRSNHKCIENSTHSNCPICDEYMFHSTKTVVFMLCGHPIHQSCFDEFSKHSYKCPVCSRTVMNMELQFRVLDKEIKESKMPDGMADWKTVIKCVDCGGKSKVPYHYLGMRCDHCKSYNTMQLKLIKANGAQSSINYEKSSGEVGFIENSLDDNFQFDGHVEGHDEPDAGLKLRGNDYDSEDEADYADNFIRVINNFDKYSSIGDAFKDWLNTSKRKSDDDNIVNEGEGDD